MESARIETWEKMLEEDLCFGAAHRWTVRCFNQVESTMDEARKLADSVTVSNPALILASRQLAALRSIKAHTRPR